MNLTAKLIIIEKMFNNPYNYTGIKSTAEK